jgi:hypothetical protein
MEMNLKFSVMDVTSEKLRATNYFCTKEQLSVRVSPYRYAEFH